MITGFKDTANSLQAKVQPTTVQNLGRFRQALDTIAQVYFEDIVSDTSEAGSSFNTINATTHVANVGDLIEITSGTYAKVKMFVQSVTTNQIVLSQRFPTELGTGVTFTICTPAVPKVSSSGGTIVTQSTLTPVNSSTANAIFSSGPIGMMPYSNAGVAASPASTPTTIEFSGLPSSIQRGDIIAIMTTSGGTAYSSTSIVGEIDSLGATNIVLKNPLPFTPTSSYKVYFYHRAYLPLRAGSVSNSLPAVTVDISNNTTLDGNDPSGVNVAGQALPIMGWDISSGVLAGVNRQPRIKNAAPASNDYALITREAGTPSVVQSGTWNIGTVTTVTAVTAITNALPAGNNAIGKLSANSGVDIGDVDVTSLPALPAGSNNIGDVDVLTLPGVAGTVAHDGVDSGNPVKIGFRARTTNVANVAADDRADAIADTLGRQVTQSSLPGTRFKGRNASLITNTTSTALISAGGAGVIYVITAISVSNGAATVGTEVNILDGSTVVWSGSASAGFGGFTQSFPDGLVCTANTAINAQCVTTGASVRANVTGHTIT